VTFSRRELLLGTALGALGANRVGQGGEAKIETKQRMRAAAKPALIAAGNAYAYLNAGYELLLKGGDTLDAAIAVVRGPEDDPNDDSVGLGGLPNEEGVVELDASCMHGPTHRAGAVGAVHNIKNVSMLAREVMLHSGHVMLVGEGAERFAVARGFQRENFSGKTCSPMPRARCGYFGKKRIPTGGGPASPHRNGASDCTPMRVEPTWID
jgi:N4-(beta-N-acetylglucosaminyl)-L-asparaginase